MSKFHTVKIIVDESTSKCSVKIDDVKMNGVKAISFNAEVGSPTEVSFTIYAKIKSKTIKAQDGGKISVNLSVPDGWQ